MDADLRQTLIAAASHFYQRGWMVGTAGNLSARLPDGSFWITASGRMKGQLTPLDFIRLGLDGTILEQPSSTVRPSAETSIHQAIYTQFPDAQACYHVHSIEANLVSRWATGNELLLPSIEMLKGLGVWEESPKVFVPVFTNHFEVPKIATEICDRFQVAPPSIPALLIRDHGVTVWGNSPNAAYNFVEVAEYLFRYMVAARRLKLEEMYDTIREG